MLKPKDQIIYTPPHTKGKINHPHAERGFVMEHKEGRKMAFCRFFHKPPLFGLRTTSCSELTPVSSLTRVNHHPQPEIDELYDKIMKGEDLE